MGDVSGLSDEALGFSRNPMWDMLVRRAYAEDRERALIEASIIKGFEMATNELESSCPKHLCLWAWPPYWKLEDRLRRLKEQK